MDRSNKLLGPGPIGLCTRGRWRPPRGLVSSCTEILQTKVFENLEDAIHVEAFDQGSPSPLAYLLKDV